MRKTKIEAQKTREHLMLAALETFYDKGIARTSLNEIAQTAGVTRGALYWHFKNKEDLFDALFQRICQDIENCMQNDLQQNNSSSWQSFEQLLDKFFTRLEHNDIHNKFYTILFFKCERIEKNHAITAIIQKYHSIWHDKLTDILNACIQEGELPASLDINFAIIFIKSNTDGLIKQWLSSPQDFRLSEAAPRLIRIMLDTLKTHALIQQQA
ncbi:TetR family transcriptional regulator [Neisseria sp. ZJ106]|uniref:TetR family transcriptional regulator n=1 Tax=Neisseria lisongii TaxID=2912188 RepID=A0AAW5ATH2_9NEIS|nr:TetR family transcriptional regulator [Neisseria lisongii]MCF7521595.1 TetR family transcriptional regulator [Neisseria lisongii]MCF7530290.1 TetR family transcriptional regulator [Neisseria lisongii]WCL71803.1 TetR family transcriptional regulator [Neisseria lisongii]